MPLDLSHVVTVILNLKLVEDCARTRRMISEICPGAEIGFEHELEYEGTVLSFRYRCGRGHGGSMRGVRDVEAQRDLHLLNQLVEMKTEPAISYGHRSSLVGQGCSRS